ncbi:hypothetical protein D9M70_613440 [compost metagenome]
MQLARMHWPDQIGAICHRHPRAIGKFDSIKARIEHQPDLVHPVFWETAFRAHFRQRPEARERRRQETPSLLHQRDSLFIKKITMLD